MAQVTHVANHVDEKPKETSPAVQPKAKPVTIPQKLRQAYPWLMRFVKKAQAKVVASRREKERALGPKLSIEELKAVADELEAIQRRINPDLERMDKLKERLKAHWGHTGVTEIKSPLGETLISFKMSVGVDPESIRPAVSKYTWLRRLTDRVLQPEKLLAYAGRDEALQATVGDALSVTLEVSVTPPSSRRPRSGKTADAEESE